MLGILLAAAPSVDVVKDLQDKVISLQDHEVAFLNTQISNIWAAVAIGVTIIVAISGGVLTYVTKSNNRAKKSMQEATEKLESTEKKNKDLDQKMEKANKILADAKNAANFAEEKLVKLADEQKELEIHMQTLNAHRKVNVMLVGLELRLKKIKALLDLYNSKNDDRFVSLIKRYKNLDKKYDRLHIEYLGFAVEDTLPDGDYAEKVNGLNEEATKLLGDYMEINPAFDLGDIE